MTPTVMGNHPKSLLEEEHHLGVPIVGRERPSVMEHQRLAATPILEVDLGPIVRRDEAHVLTSVW
jgi:hypothetical protein